MSEVEKSRLQAIDDIVPEAPHDGPPETVICGWAFDRAAALRFLRAQPDAPVNLKEIPALTSDPNSVIEYYRQLDEEQVRNHREDLEFQASLDFYRYVRKRYRVSMFAFITSMDDPNELGLALWPKKYDDLFRIYYAVHNTPLVKTIMKMNEELGVPLQWWTGKFYSRVP